MSTKPTAQLYVILILCILAWGLAWPISKIGLGFMEPIWYSAYRLIIGFVAIMIYLLATSQFKLPSRHDLPLIISIGVFQMGLFLILLNYGLYYVGAGRAAILVYSTPLWATPLAIVFFGESLNRFKTGGLLFGIAGIITLFSPWRFDWHNTHVVVGNMMLLAAAITWAFVMIHTRYGKWHSKPIQLVPWQMALAAVMTIMTAVILEPHPSVIWNSTLTYTLLYNGLAATAFGFWASVVVARSLPVTTTSLSFLAVPVVGLLSSVLILHEQMTAELGIALCLIITGLVLVTLGNKPKVLHAANQSTMASQS